MRTRSVQTMAAGCTTVLACLAIATMPSTATASAPGNNGTIKVLPEGDIDAIPDNQPHVGCAFQLEWYGFDADATSAVTFEQQAPTTDGTMTVSGPSSVQLDGDPGNGAGNGGFDGTATYTLAFTGAPHPQQGYHVKLTINTNESKGADVKHKVFWVEDCAAPTPTPVVTPTPATTPTPAGPPGTPGTPGTPDSAPTQSPTAAATVTPPATVAPGDTIISSTTATATPTEVAGNDEPEVVGNDEPEVLGAQASADTSVKQGKANVAARNPQAVPSSINAGSDASAGHQGALVLTWLAGLATLLGGLALLARRRRV